MATKLFIVALGNSFDGISLYGTFKDFESAEEWAEQTGEEWNIVPVQNID